MIAMLFCTAMLCAGALLLGSYIHRLGSAANVNEELARIYNEEAAAAQDADQEESHGRERL